MALQRSDGGWSLATLGSWKREDGSEQTKDVSDGYGTGLVVFVLRRTGIAADDARLQKGVTWLKRNQRESGRWYTRSLHKDSKHFISHAGTAPVRLAIANNLPLQRGDFLSTPQPESNVFFLDRRLFASHDTARTSSGAHWLSQ